MVPVPLSKNQLTLFRKLSQRKYREQHRLFIAEGLRTVEQILTRGALQVIAVVISQRKWSDGSIAGASSSDAVRGINVRSLEVGKSAASSSDAVRGSVGGALIGDPEFRDIVMSFRGYVYSVAEEDFSGLTDTEQHQGILAVCRMPEAAETTDFAALSGGVLLATDRIQDPGNLGTMIRTAAWFDAVGVLLGEGSVDIYNPKVVRSTAGSTGILPVRESILVEDLALLKSAGWDIVVLDASEGSIPITQYSFLPRTVIVVGNEGNGPSEAVKSISSRRIAIPGNAENVESLNAAVATSIALYAVFGNRL
jgi:RNA methyltransferase, TrmH family